MKSVVERKLFAELNTASAEEQDLALSFPDAEIGIATVIDEFRAASTYGAINYAARVQAKEIEFFRPARPPNFIVSDAKLSRGEPLASVLDHFSAGRNRLGREYASVMNSRAANPEGISGELGINKLTAFLTRVHRERCKSRKEAAARRRQPV